MIEEAAANNKVVYYTELGYVLYPRPKRNELSGDSWIQYSLDYHVCRIKQLSVFFDKIMIPYSHIYCIVDRIHGELIKRFLLHTDIRYYIERHVLFAGGWGGVDFYDLKEHQLLFLNQIQWPTECVAGISDLTSLSNMAIGVRNVKIQGDSLGEMMAYYRYLVSGYHEKYAGDLIEAIKTSTVNDLPFVHQVFWRKLKEINLTDAQRYSAYIESNRIYFKAGEIGNPGVIVYSMIDTEPFLGGRYVNESEIPAIMYSPEVFKALAMCYYSESEFVKIFRKSAEEIYSLRDKLWKSFVSEYHGFLNDVAYVAQIEDVEDLFKQKKLSYFLMKDVIVPNTAKYSSLFDMIAKMIFMILKIKSLPFPVVLDNAESVIEKPIAIWKKDVLMRLYRPVFKKWFDRVKKTLRI